jgi:hypothetical protein
MDFLSTLLGALIGATGAVLAAYITIKPKPKPIDFPEEIIHLARNTTGLRRSLLLSVRKYDKGKKIEPDGDRNTSQIAGYSILELNNLVNVIKTDSGAVIVTLTDLGWKVSTAIDSLPRK